MGRKCRIIENNNGTVTVLDNNGRESRLFNQIRNYLSGIASQTDTTLQDEVNNVVTKARVKGQYLMTPKGQVTNLSDTNWALVRTPSFLREFGDWTKGKTTLLLDNNGEPIIAHRGDVQNIQKFSTSQGSFFASDYSVAQGYAGNTGQVYSALLKSAKTFTINEESYNTFKGTMQEYMQDWYEMDNSELAQNEMFQEFKRNFIMFRNESGSAVKEFMDSYNPSVNNKMSDEEIRDIMAQSLRDVYTFTYREADYREFDPMTPFIRAMGYDAVIRDYDKNGQALGQEYVMFDNNQIIPLDSTRTIDLYSTVENEIRKIKDTAIQDGTFLKAPNGENSNLKEPQWTYVRTQAFKDWFGDWQNSPETASRVLDENGEPMVVYHGSPYGGIEYFDHTKKGKKSLGSKEFGSHFASNKKVAEFYKDRGELSDPIREYLEKQIFALQQVQEEVRNNREYNALNASIENLRRQLNGKVYEVFLNIRRPKIFDAEGQDFQGWQNLKQDVGYDIKRGTEAIEAIVGLNPASTVSINYDGIIGNNIADISANNSDISDMLGSVYMVWNGDDIRLTEHTETGSQNLDQPLSVESMLNVSNTNSKSTQEALLLWGISNTAAFDDKVVYDNEPSLQQVVQFYNEYGDGSLLSDNNIDDIHKITSTLPVTATQLVNESPNHYLSKKIRSVDAVANIPDIQPIERIGLLAGITDYTSQTDFNGVQESSTATDILQQLDAVYLDNVTTQEDIVANAEMLPDSISESIIENADVQRRLFNYYRYMESTPVYNADGESINPAMNTTVRDTIVNTILNVTNVGNPLSTMAVLQSISPDVWKGNLKSIDTLLKSLAKDAVNINLDLVSLPDRAKVKSIEETKQFITDLYNLLEVMESGIADTTDVNVFVDSYLNYFGITEDQVYKPLRNSKNMALFVVNNVTNEGLLFEQQGLVKVYDNVYQRVNADQTLDNIVSQNSELIPQFIYDGVEINSPILRSRIIDYFSRVVPADVQFDTRENLAKYNMAKYLTMTNMNNTISTQVDESIAQAKNLEVINDEYLSTDFVSEFYNYILREKLSDSTLYNRLLKYFSVSNNGIEVQGEMSSLSEELSNWAESNTQLQNLIDYTQTLPQNSSLWNIVNVVNSELNTPTDIVNASIINPSIVPQYQGAYSTLNETEIQLPNYAADVVKIDGVDYKIIDRNSNIYSSILEVKEQDSNKDFFTKTVSEPVLENEVSTKQRQEIVNRIDNC